MHATYKAFIFYGSQVKLRLKLTTERQTGKQTNRQDKNNTPRSFDPGHKYVTAGGTKSPRGHIKPSSAVNFG